MEILWKVLSIRRNEWECMDSDFWSSISEDQNITVGATWFNKKQTKTWKHPRCSNWVTLAMEYCPYNQRLKKVVRDCWVHRNFEC
jgi:hypothetical protein